MWKPIIRRCVHVVGVESATRLPSTPLAAGDRGDSAEKGARRSRSRRANTHSNERWLDPFFYTEGSNDKRLLALYGLQPRECQQRQVSMIRVNRVVKYFVVKCDADHAAEIEETDEATRVP